MDTRSGDWSSLGFTVRIPRQWTCFDTGRYSHLYKGASIFVTANGLRPSIRSISCRSELHTLSVMNIFINEYSQKVKKGFVLSKSYILRWFTIPINVLALTLLSLACDRHIAYWCGQWWTEVNKYYWKAQMLFGGLHDLISP